MEKIAKTEEGKTKFAKKMKFILSKAKNGLVHVGSWLVNHAAVIWGTLFGALVIFLKGYFKGHEEGRVEEHERLEKRDDLAYRLAMRQIGMTEPELEELGETMELIDDLGGPKEAQNQIIDYLDNF